MIRAENLTKRFGPHTALNDLNLKVAPGEIFCLVGGNGAGKTTTIHLFLGFLSPTSGKAWVDGIEVSKNPTQTRQRVSYIPEQVALYPQLTAMENLAYFDSLTGQRLKTVQELEGILDRVRLNPRDFHRKVGLFSKGMRQKVAIGIAIAKSAKGIFMDEPTSGLDPRASNEFTFLLGELQREEVAILMVTHDLWRAKDAKATIGIMHSGELVKVVHTEEMTHQEIEQIALKHLFEQ